MIALVAAARRRVERAGRVADRLAAAWDAFAVLGSACRVCERQDGELFAAFAFAAAAAAQGRLALAAAPSLPAVVDRETGPGLSVHDDLGVIADELADLAGALREALRTAGREAGQAGDRAACAQAEAQAAHACGLLARGGP